MKVTFTDNINIKFIDVLQNMLKNACETKFGIAFAKYSGYSLIEDKIETNIEKGCHTEFILGLDFKTTEPKILNILRRKMDENKNLFLYCFCDYEISDSPIYHPKIYIARKDDEVNISIGSSNLTAGGFKKNIEINTIITANVNEEIVSDVYSTYNRLKYSATIFTPDYEYINQYEQAYNIIRRNSKDILKKKELTEKIGLLEEKEETLPKPRISSEDLFGWQKIVYAKIPGNSFKSSDLYIYEKEFQLHYPDNKHITAKVRQILQQLRDLGLIRAVSRNRWEKMF